MSKIVLIRRSNKSHWISCQSITKNLEDCYHKAFPTSKILIIEVENNSDKYTQWKLAEKISEAQPDIISFIDHQPHPANILLPLNHILDGQLPQTIFHVFGDFTLNTQDWISLENIFIKNGPLFLCASNKHVGLLKNLIDTSFNAIQRFPFPINQGLFKFEEYFEKSSPLELTTFLYTGRLSTQKNIAELIRYFNQFNSEIMPESELLIAGPYDDLGIPFLEKPLLPGAYAHMIESLIEKIGNPNIKLLGEKNHLELVKLYREADLFISISTHNDEDFGMAPAEALSCGTPCILTDWGGYSDFSRTKYAELIPVEFQNSRILPNQNDLIKSMYKAANTKVEQKTRKEISQKAHLEFSIDSLALELEKIINSIEGQNSTLFSSFSNNIRAISSSHQIYGNCPSFKSYNNSYSNLYKSIYQPYFRNNNE
jgi:glycosyltransferase involved in cell wall biosynthesis